MSKTRVYWMTRSNGMWQAFSADVPDGVLEQYKKSFHGPDLMGMCLAKIETDFHRLPETTKRSPAPPPEPPAPESQESTAAVKKKATKDPHA